MNINKYLIFFIILLVLIVSYVITYKINKIDYFTIDSGVEGPILLLIAGTHGNEPSGTIGLEDFMNSDIKITKGKIIIVPRVNKIGLFFGTRWGFNSFIPIDYNRNYPLTKEDEKGIDAINRQILNLVNKSDLTIDFHEGWDFNVVNPKSMGSGIYPSNTILVQKISKNVLSDINKDITDSNKKFTINFDSPRILYTLDSYCNTNNKNYILIEITGQNDIQPMELRINQVLKVIDSVLKNLQMK